MSTISNQRYTALNRPNNGVTDSILKYTGKFFISVFNIKTGINKEIELNNMIMTLRWSEIINIFAGVAPSLQIKYLALGTSSTAVSGSETQLGTEVFRTQVTTQNNPSAGVLYTTFNVLENDYIGQIEELGIFCLSLIHI